MRFTLLVALVALAVPAAAVAKGPSRAEVTGPGLDEALVVTGSEAPGTPLMNLAESAGFFPLVFGQTPDPTLRTRPKGSLGAKYAVVYRVPGPDRTSTIREDIYPHAKPFPVSYMKPGQPFWNGMRTHGGWFVGDARLKSTLVHGGLPRTPPNGGGRGEGWIVGIVGASLLVLAGAVAVILRRRPHGRAAAEPT